jgi:hypothetical protein
VISARIIAGSTGEVDEIHLLTTAELTPKQTVRNVESALLAHLGMRVSHKKISVATSSDPNAKPMETVRQVGEVVAVAMGPAPMKRRVYFEDVEVRRSRTKGVACRVTLKKGDATFVGEAEGIDGDRHRIELAAKATLTALQQTETAGVLAVLDATNRWVEMVR